MSQETAKTIVQNTVMTVGRLGDAVARYAQARHNLSVKKKEKATEELPHKEALAAIRKKYEVALAAAGATEPASIDIARLYARMAKAQKLFGEKKARLPLDGIGYAEVQKPKRSVQIVDLDTFLDSDLAKALIIGISIDEGAALRLFDRKPIPGLEVTIRAPVIKFSTSKWKPEEQAKEDVDE